MFETSNVGPDTESLRIEQRIEDLDRAIQNRLPIIKAAEDARLQQSLVDNIVAGTVSNGDPGFIRRHLLAAKAKLKQLVGMAVGANEARAANVVDQQTVEKLRVDLVAAGDAYRAKTLLIDNMSCEI